MKTYDSCTNLAMSWTTRLSRVLYWDLISFSLEKVRQCFRGTLSLHPRKQHTSCFIVTALRDTNSDRV
jgi:hypothetical protein